MRVSPSFYTPQPQLHAAPGTERDFDETFLKILRMHCWLFLWNPHCNRHPGWTSAAAAQVCVFSHAAHLAMFTGAFEKLCVLILCGSVNLRLVEAINELPAEVARRRLR